MHDEDQSRIGSRKGQIVSIGVYFVSWLAQDGTSVYVIKDLLGHSDVKTTQICSHLQPESLHNEVNKIKLEIN
jgi:integrase